jgi:hypothetical protein
MEDDAKIENDPRFLQRIEEARRELREGRGVRLEDMGIDDPLTPSPQTPESPP